MRFLPRISLLLVCLWTVLSFGTFNPVRAQVGAEEDDYAKALYSALREAISLENPLIFKQAVERDPLMSRRAFVAALRFADKQLATSPADSNVAISFAASMALQISESFQDPEPLKIMQGIVDKRPRDSLVLQLDAYAITLVGESSVPKKDRLRADGYGSAMSRVSHLEPGIWPKLRPILAKINRAWLSLAFAEPRLSIQEIDTFAPLMEAKASLDGLDDLIATRDAVRLAVVGELGLLDEFEASLRKVIQKNLDATVRASLLLSGYRLGLQKNRLDIAARYLAEAKATLANSENSSPALDYALLTAEYQLRRMQGFQPDSATRLAEFRKAWSALDGYEPLQRVGHDYFWYYGRKATSYWLSDFESDRVAGREVAVSIEPQLLTWLQISVAFDSLAVYTADDLLMYTQEFYNALTVKLAMADQALLLAELYPDILQPKQIEVEIATPIERMVKDLGRLPETLGLDIDGPYFPAFDVTHSGLYSELMGRTRLLRARDPRSNQVELLGQALTLIDASGFADVELKYQLEIGDTYQTLGESKLAITTWERAFQSASELEDRLQALEASTRLAQELWRVKDFGQAGLWAALASKELEEGLALYPGGSADSLRLAKLASAMAEISIQSALRLNNPSKAFAAVQSGKQAQLAADQMSGQGKAQAAVAQVQKQKEDVAALSAQAKKLEAMPASETRDELLRKTQTLIADTRGDFLLRSRELRQKYPALYSRVLKFDPLDLPDIQRSLPAEAAVVQYFSTEDGLYIFLVTREFFRLRSVAVTEAELDALISSFARGLRRNIDGDSKLQSESEALYSYLIEPCAADLVDKKILVFLPTGRLNILPFACLSNSSGDPLIQDKLVLELAKPTDFLRIDQTQPEKIESVVAFANATGDLPAAALEGQKIAALFPGSKLFEGDKASKKNFFQFGEKAQVLHLATHGESNLEDSLANYLKLAGSDQIAQEEIFALDLTHTNIVTLSACNTAVGDSTDSRFVASLAEAFWIGGSQSVVASLWAVNDESTSLLMTAFYQGLRDGKSKVLSLRDAQLKVRATPGYEHPYFWAGFVLFGDWR